MTLNDLIQMLSAIDPAKTWATVLSLVKEPGQNPSLALLVLAAASLLMLLIVLALLLVLTPRRRAVKKVRRYRIDPRLLDPVNQGMFARMLAAPEAPEASTPALAHAQASKRRADYDRFVLAVSGPFVVAGLIVLAFVGTYFATSTNAFCAGACHGAQKTVREAHILRHARCVQCHERPGVTGVAANVSSRLRMAVGALGGAESGSATADSGACIRCHGAVRTQTTTSERGIRVSHKEFLAEGEPCVSCHQGLGHVKVAYQRGMSTCIVCHDGKKASQKCTTCHVTDPTQTAFASDEPTSQPKGSGRYIYPTVQAANRECGNCHDLPKNCDPCHAGVRMPHSDEYKRHGHAMAAAFERKAVCWRCHEPSYCNNCHTGIERTGVSGHLDDWKSRHKGMPANAGCACHVSRPAVPKRPFCQACH